jgi:type 1 glutamine amidotransferase
MDRQWINGAQGSGAVWRMLRLCAAMVLIDGATAAAGPAIRVLVYSRTMAFRHPSIADATAWFDSLPQAARIDPRFSEDPATFTADGLADVDVVAFVNTTGDVLDPAGEEALRTWMEAGGGFAGVHAAADTEHQWPWYGDMLGASFTTHGPIVTATLSVGRRRHAASRAWRVRRFPFTDEYYDFDRNPRANARVLLTVAAADLVGTTMGSDHPIAWIRRVGWGRVFYTNLGHQPETWADPRFRAHLLAGIRWAARRTPARRER